jgi:hypothetical protein
MGEAVRAVWDTPQADAQAVCDTLSIREQPCFNGANCYTKAHLRRWYRQPPLHTGRSARAVTIQVDQHNPWCKPRCVIVPAEALQQLLLALSSVNHAQAQTDMFENTSQDRFVDISLHGTCDDDFPVFHALLSEE